MLLSAVAIALSWGWGWLEAEVRVMTPWRRLARGNAQSQAVLQMSLHGVPIITFWKALYYCNFYHALVAFAAILSQLLVIAVVGIPYNFGVVQNVSLFSSTACLGILAIQIVVACTMFWFRHTNQIMPRQPNTIANLIMLLCASPIIEQFNDLGPLPASQEDLRNRVQNLAYDFKEKRCDDGKTRTVIEVREIA